mgnify:CR=1 FL=1
MRRLLIVSSVIILSSLGSLTASACETSKSWDEFFDPDGMARQRTLIGSEFLKFPPNEQWSYVAGVLDGWQRVVTKPS